MQVTFGLCLDARQGSSTQNYFNAPVVGRLGFLSLLETYLGLSAPEVHTAQRVAAYLGHLQKVDDGTRFFSESMKTDNVGTAARLLSWRDEWRLGGWNGSAPKDAPRRIRELAMVEQSGAKELASGEAERLAVVALALRSGNPTPVKSVQVVDPIEAFPWAWRQVLGHLPNITVCAPQAQGTGQLRALQELALQAIATGSLDEKLPPIADGSIQLVQAMSQQTPEHWLSTLHGGNPADRLIMAEELGDSLDTTLAATGSANCGFESPSPLRPALQALGLALELCWAPLDVGRLVDFLTHPVGPFSRSARARLAGAVAEQPGIGGQAWKDVKDKIAAAEDGEALRVEVEFWLEVQRWPRADGAPIDVLLVRVDKLRDAFRRRLTGDASQAAIFMPAHQQCSAVFDALTELTRQGAEKVLPRQVEQLIAHASPGAVNPASAAQVVGMRSARNAAACIDAADEIIWWMPSSPVLPSQLPWSESEVQALAKMAVELRDPARELALLAFQWLRPLLAARKRFVLVLPPPGAEEHPVRQLLLRLAPDLQASALDLDVAVNDSFHGTLAEHVASVSFPEVPRYIQLQQPVARPKGPQSFTSLNELFNDPALFALKRMARLRSMSVLAVEEDNRLLGTLAHRVFEKLFENVDALQWSNEQALHWFHTHIDKLLQTEGALLLMQGAGVSQQRFRMTCERAISVLINHLHSAGVVRVQTEVEFDGVLGDVPLTGNVDLLLELADSRTVALDMKWRGDKYYSSVLLEGRHLQLALYSSLIAQKTGAAPAALGYFILESGALLLTTADIFPNAQLRKPREDVTVAELLNQANTTWQWRTGQLEAGQIEVVPLAPTDEYAGPEGTLTVTGPSTWDRDHLLLLGGWQE